MNAQLKKYYAFLESITPANEELVNAVMEAVYVIFEQNEPQGQPAQPEENLPPMPEENLPPQEAPPQEPALQQAPPVPQPQSAPAGPAPLENLPGEQTAGEVEKNVEKIATQQPSSFRDTAPTYKKQITDLQKSAASLLPQIASFTAKNPNDAEAKKYQEILTQSAKQISQLAGYTARATQMQNAPQMQQQPAQTPPVQQGAPPAPPM